MIIVHTAIQDDVKVRQKYIVFLPCFTGRFLCTSLSSPAPHLTTSATFVYPYNARVQDKITLNYTYLSVLMQQIRSHTTLSVTTRHITEMS